MWTKELELRIRELIESKGVSIYPPYGLQPEELKVFWPKCFQSIRKILTSYRVKKPELKRKYLEKAEEHLRNYPEEFLRIKKQLDYKHNQ